MFKIDWKKWKAAVDAASTAVYAAEKLTLLYSIRAMARGRVHRKRAKLTASTHKKLRPKAEKPTWGDFTDAHGQIAIDLDAADQAAFVGERWKEFEATRDQETKSPSDLMVSEAR
jgi:hypothetical protein